MKNSVTSFTSAFPVALCSRMVYFHEFEATMQRFSVPLIILLCAVSVHSFQLRGIGRIARQVTPVLHSMGLSVVKDVHPDDWPSLEPDPKVPNHRSQPENNKRVVKSSTMNIGWQEAADNEADGDLGFVSDRFRSGFVSILGNPNVGKSTLLNGLLGESLCIVSPKPQTTRHRILGILTVEPTDTEAIANPPAEVHHDSEPGNEAVSFEKDGYQLIFADTPGMLSPAYKLQEVMQDTVRGAANDADVILLVTDVYGEPLVDDNIMTKLSLTTRPVVVAINKVDIAAKEHRMAGVTSSSGDDGAVTHAAGGDDSGSAHYTDNAESAGHMEAPSANKKNDHRSKRSAAKSLSELRTLWTQRLPRAELVEISALQGRGTTQLLHTILAHIPLGPLYYPKDTLTTRNERFFTAEIIRECILRLYKDEIPYSCEVTIESFKDRSAGLSAIEADIVVSRQSQKAIVIGKGGAQLKELGILAREKLEKFLDRKVYLALRVRVDEEWRSNTNSLKQYGYIEHE